MYRNKPQQNVDIRYTIIVICPLKIFFYYLLSTLQSECVHNIFYKITL